MPLPRPQARRPQLRRHGGRRARGHRPHLPGLDRPQSRRSRDHAARGVRLPDREHALPGEPAAVEAVRHPAQSRGRAAAPARRRRGAAQLRARRRRPGDIAIPAGTQVASGDGAVVFTVIQPATLAKDAPGTTAAALHCEQVDGELAGYGTGAPGQSVRVRRGPIVAPSGDGLDVIVGIEATSEDLADGTASRGIDGKAFALWQLLDSFADATPGHARLSRRPCQGLIVFAPIGDGNQTLARVPPQGREIRVWYRRGGGRAGNVAAGTLATIKNPPLKLTVTNPDRASGGRDAEDGAGDDPPRPARDQLDALRRHRARFRARRADRGRHRQGAGLRAGAALAPCRSRRRRGSCWCRRSTPKPCPTARWTAAVMADHRRDELRTLATKLIDDRRRSACASRSSGRRCAP